MTAAVSSGEVFYQWQMTYVASCYSSLGWGMGQRKENA